MDDQLGIGRGIALQGAAADGVIVRACEQQRAGGESESCVVRAQIERLPGLGGHQFQRIERLARRDDITVSAGVVKSAAAARARKRRVAGERLDRHRRACARNGEIRAANGGVGEDAIGVRRGGRNAIGCAERAGGVDEVNCAAGVAGDGRKGDECVCPRNPAIVRLEG